MVEFQRKPLQQLLRVITHLFDQAQRFAIGADQDVLAVVQVQTVDFDAARASAELSGGMIKRVAIARAIVLNPRYLFCDEPNSGLDPQTSIVIDNLIHEITREYNITTIINTHDMNSVMEIGEKIVYIHEGRKWWEGTKDDILHADNPELNDFVFASAMAKKAKLAAK